MKSSTSTGKLGNIPQSKKVDFDFEPDGRSCARATVEGRFGSRFRAGWRVVRPLERGRAGGYFAFNRFGLGPFGLLKPLVAGYVNSLPVPLRGTCLNPFVIAEVRR